jgi:hypothetical protein
VGLVVNTLWPGKVMLEVESETVGPPPVPVPLRPIICGLFPALSEIAIAALREPTTVGVKFTRMVQLPPTAMDAGQLLLWKKSPVFAPVIPMPKIPRAAEPVLLNVID